MRLVLLAAPPQLLSPAPSSGPVTELRDAIGGFAPISLAETQRAALMDRVECKFLTTLERLQSLLPVLWPHYQALEVGGTRLQGYSSVYHDTADFGMYLAHHNGRARRHKVRTRHYRQTGQTFLELKLRDPKGRTRKERVAVTGPATSAVSAQRAFLAAHLPALAHTPLEPKLEVHCERLTLVGCASDERLTFDLHLALTTPELRCDLPGLVVIERKRAGAGARSAFDELARQLELHGQPFSKYGVGCALLYPDLKRNAFKPSLISLYRLVRPEQAPSAQETPR
ncbi:polyphosphate polymerase domain-containing protein [Deinococcus navajonensis]|uniref:Polyphosphate polymerase domain-containing protein n=1 Tax=Deinococcus navajonensis TaxID=309884 RepID=A0ABV8XJL2_9DEIO